MCVGIRSGCLSILYRHLSQPALMSNSCFRSHQDSNLFFRLIEVLTVFDSKGMLDGAHEKAVTVLFIVVISQPF